MFCTKCGANNENISSFCTSCGAPLDTKPEASAKTNSVNIFKNKIFWGIAAAVVLFVLVIIMIKLQPKKINVEEFIKISYSGYDGYAKANAYLDEDGLYGAIMEAKGSKELDLDELDSIEALFNSELISDYYDLWKCIDLIDLDISPNINLSNGDDIKVDISYDNEKAKEHKIKFTGKSVSETVKELKAVAQINPFNDLAVSFSGISPNGYLEYYYVGDNSYIGTYSFYVDKRDSLKNGDIITISIDFSDEDTLYNGYVLSQKEKQYVVEGLEEYIDSYSDLPSDFLEELKKEAQDTIYAYIADSYYKECSDLSYSGYILNTVKPDPAYFNCYNDIYIIYSGLVSHSEGKFRTSRVYFPIKFSDILKKGDEVYYSYRSDIIGDSNFNNSWSYYTNGYINPFICYTDLVNSYRDNYTTECGDGFEDYAKYETISTISDIREDFRNELANDAKDIIESYVASEYSEDSHMKDLSLMGEYLLIAKNQGTDFVNNNKYILVYSATIYNDNNNFETSEIYLPVEYDGIVSLPNQEYMVTVSKGILGYTYIGNSWYYTNGYSNEQEMFKEIVTANRDLYTYEVSDGLKEFDE